MSYAIWAADRDEHSFLQPGWSKFPSKWSEQRVATRCGVVLHQPDMESVDCLEVWEWEKLLGCTRVIGPPQPFPI